MKFKGTPNQLVRFQTKNLRNGRKTGVRFDADGFYETEHPRLIKALSRKFEIVDEIKKEVKQEKVKEEVKVYSCKKCDFTTDNRGKLMAHYRKEHSNG